MEKTIKEQIMELAEEEYRLFSSKLIPNIDNITGVRLPALRKIAQRIARSDWRSYLAEAEDDYFEETMLQGMVIGYAVKDIDEVLEYTARFVPKINNWSVCDSFCGGLKLTRSHLDKVWDFLQPYLQSDQEYDLRFGAVMLLEYYVLEDYIDRVLQILDGIRHEGYYVKMAVAWAVSICYIKLPEPTLAYLQHSTLDLFTYNKALQKITESYRVDQATKQMIRSMKRKA
ncbi:DNA alkylation repair protein [Paenibacillus sp. GM2]|uniref:DNA alkylation repair protein n=1 Tax=Paenibacillus sp. GM2 TaxID=1622070 RepID=UPI000839B7CC|nr:DNA alkylation repair protein [Paenibacillus sp. GM2]